MKSKKNQNSKFEQSIYIAVSIGVLSVLAGLGGYKFLHPESAATTQASSKTSITRTKETSWPEVQYLSKADLTLLTEEQLLACSKAIKKGSEKLELADKTNYGNRDALDAIDRKIPHKPELIILHETVISAGETIKLFKTPHPNDQDQASYHVLVDRTGGFARIVPDGKRAYGSGFSKFGDFTVHNKSRVNFSINNVALHISLESPTDGQRDTSSHSGYTRKQYSSLAKQILLWQAKYGIPVFRITTHASVDRSHSRYDPRSFRWDELDYYHRLYAKTCDRNILTLPI